MKLKNDQHMKQILFFTIYLPADDDISSFSKGFSKISVNDV